ncbi:putative deoxyribodipyrimidine photo-lyase [Leptospira ryugenii]|uniref:Deoxyribodipyrimidine photo-lyase n=1 Tax=Leptospira ryugenii TaxID=1917863 RepID=A0A2P2DZ04_9LEPT|nr:FAD-binding domain-containing protein [Leptospira ryugenii]GBF49859.1 putative deoxyribodipyrimidine photo-lyase [Leptospira ryugenii]
MTVPKERIRKLNSKPINEQGKYILYWMQAYRRFDANHSFAYALQLAKSYNKHLLVYEGLRSDYEWSSPRIHQFILEGMIENRKRAEELGINYWAFVETRAQNGKGILRNIAKDAYAIVTDDFPCFIIPEQSKSLADKCDVMLLAVDGNSVIPLSLFERPASAARIMRTWIQKKFPDFLLSFAKPKWNKSDIQGTNGKYAAPFSELKLETNQISSLLMQIQLKETTSPVKGVIGGRSVALRLLKDFLDKKITKYADERSNPKPPVETPVSFLSPYLHFGHIGAEEIVRAVMESVSPKGLDWEQLSFGKAGDRETFYTKDPAANHYLDELITWRDIGYLFFFKNPSFRKDLKDLPDWVKENLKKHKKDHREFLYDRSTWEAAKTHDPLWNAAQTELALTGRMHNYMRMLWGKKVIEWSATYEEAFDTLEYLNNKYAYDGRNPNSYTGILWCFGLFDRPWFPERNVFGNIRYMSSQSTMKKFKMQSYLDYVKSLEGDPESLFS